MSLVFKYGIVCVLLAIGLAQILFPEKTSQILHQGYKPSPLYNKDAIMFKKNFIIFLGVLFVLFALFMAIWV